MNNMPPVSSNVVLAWAAACVVTLISTAALGACHATLRGELVPDDHPNQGFRVVPQKFLFFSLHELREENGLTFEEVFQAFTVPNTKITFPIPFALNIDSPRDCPKQLTLKVNGSGYDGFHHEYPMGGWKEINLEKSEFESARVLAPTF